MKTLLVISLTLFLNFCCKETEEPTPEPYDFSGRYGNEEGFQLRVIDNKTIIASEDTLAAVYNGSGEYPQLIATPTGKCKKFAKLVLTKTQTDFEYGLDQNNCDGSKTSFTVFELGL